MNPVRLGIIATHPIQYHVPWFRGLAARPDLETTVYFALIPDAVQQGVGFGVPFQWDIPMLEGYVSRTLVNTTVGPRLGSFFGTSTPGIREALQRDRPDVVIINGWNALPLLQALRASERLAIRRIVRGESNAMRRRPFWVRPLHRALLARFNGFLAIGKASRAFYLENGVDASRIFLAPYFVDNDRFSRGAAAADRASLRRKWGIAEDAVCFLFVGKLQPKKRPIDLVRALGKLDAADRAHLLVVGTGEQEKEARALAAASGIRATFAGFLNQSELPNAYAAGDCLVLPSDFGETWGLVVNEAMACGLPAIVSDRVGCGPDLVEDGRTGHVFAFGDAAALAETLRSICRDKRERRAMGEAARRKVAEYSVDHAVRATADAVHAVAGTMVRP